MGLWPHMRPHIVSVRFDPINLAGLQNEHTIFIPHEQAVRLVISCGGQQSGQSVLKIPSRASLEGSKSGGISRTLSNGPHMLLPSIEGQQILKHRQFVPLSFTLNCGGSFLDIDHSKPERIRAHFDFSSFTFRKRAVVNQCHAPIGSSGNSFENQGYLLRQLRCPDWSHHAVREERVFAGAIIENGLGNRGCADCRGCRFGG